MSIGPALALVVLGLGGSLQAGAEPGVIVDLPVMHAAERGDGRLFFFDGFETYSIDTTPLNATFSPAFNGTVPPWGPAPLPYAPNGGASMYVAVATPLAASGIEPPMTIPFSPAAPDNPHHPSYGPPFDADRDPLVNQVLMDGRGSRTTGVSNTFAGLRSSLAAAVRGLTNDPLIVTIDVFLGDRETQTTLRLESRRLGNAMMLIDLTRHSGEGRWYEDASGFTRKPLVAGLDGVTFGYLYYALPPSPAPGLPEYEMPLNEWVRIAVVHNWNSVAVFVRDSSTDGSNGILIDDPSDYPGLEVGWAELMPGQPAELLSNENGVAVYTGYGRALRVDTMEPALSPNPNPVGEFDQFLTVAHPEVGVTLPDSRAVNQFFDNLTVSGRALCEWDWTGDGLVNAADLANLLGNWGAPGANSQSLAQMLGSWGACD